MGYVMLVTPQKINMEPRDHPIEKENNLNQASIFHHFWSLR